MIRMVGEKRKEKRKWCLVGEGREEREWWDLRVFSLGQPFERKRKKFR